jgi:anti-sigma factor RsiW
MNCLRVQSLLSAYLDQELNPDERRMVRTHLFQCSVCDHEFQTLSALKQVMGRLSSPIPPQSAAELFHQHVHGFGLASYSSASAFFNLRHLSLTAACFSMFLLTSVLIFPQQEIPSGMVTKETHTNLVNPSVQVVNQLTDNTLEVANNKQPSVQKDRTNPFPVNRHINTVLSGIAVSR